MEKTEIVMTTEEKAKAYDEALGHARQAYGTGAYDDQTLEAIFPQLCESEDERIRKHLIAIVEMYWGKANDPDKAKELAYLKKQKEPHYTKRNTLFDKCVAQCDPVIMKKVSDKIDEMLQKEQNWNKKPCLTCQEYEKGHKQGYTEGCTAGYNKAMKEIEQKEQPTNEEMLRTLRAEYEKGVADTIAKYEQKEQKEIPLMNGDADLYFDNWIQYNDTTKRGCFEEGIRYAQRLQKEQNLIMANSPQLKEQKPADLPAGFYVTLPDGKKYYTKEMRCKGMNIKVVEPKPVDWGEEDEEMLNLTKTQLRILQSHLSHAHSESMSDMEYSSKLLQIEKCVSWLDIRFKSLRPQPKVELSEDVKKTLDEVSHILIGLNYTQVAKDYKQAVEKLLSLRPSWRPSEEQMEALRVTIDFMPDTFKPRCTLITLQNGLEKLM